ncbi:U3 small nucleolar RNA-associated protein [Coemansia sp. RSA 552]|nr:U3 small nucleolar RNA-associated protein [Coemansia sp. RSA 552]
MQVHRCRFTDYVPQAINGIAITPGTARQAYVAVGRAGGDIEVWSARGRLIHEKTLAGVGTLETLTWAHQTELTAEDLEVFETLEEQTRARRRLAARAPRLFSAGLNAVVVEWDVARLAPKAAADSGGGAVWCMATNHAQTQLAVGTEDGHIRIFDLTDDRLEHVRSLERVRGRVLSVAWGAADQSVVAGTADGCVRVWDAATGRLTARMTVAREGRDATLVWAVAVLPDGTIVTGDSRGHVIFWDATTHVVQQDFRALGADVLTVVAAADGRAVFASGVDPKITQFRRSPATRARWQLAGIRRYHTHDVRALGVSSELVISGGVDTQVTASSARGFPNSNPYRQPCFAPGSTSVAAAAGLVLQRQGRELKLWALGRAEPAPRSLSEQMESGQALQLYSHQRDLARLELSTTSSLISSAISPSGDLVAASDATGARLYQIARDGDVVRIRRVRGFPPPSLAPAYSEARGATQMEFTADEQRLVVATTDGFVCVVNISNWRRGQFTTERRHCAHRSAQAQVEADAGCSDVPTHAAVARFIAPAVADMRTIIGLAISPDARFIASRDSAGYLAVSRLDAADYVLVPGLGPRSADEWPTALGFTPNGLLVITTARNRVLVWDPSHSGFTKWSRAFGATAIPRSFVTMATCVVGLAANPTEPSCIYAYAADHVTRIDLDLPPGPARAVLNVHKRKQIERDVIDRVVEEKDACDRRLARRQRRRAEQSDQSDQAELSDHPKQTSQARDWEATIVARLREAGINVAQPNNFQMTQRYQSLMHAAFTGNDTLVVVERPWIDVAAALPAAYHRHKYGT